MNPQEIALDFALNTSKNLFITGKAGSGKTTFLKKLVAETTKNTIVAAPTAVAALNAGGVTLHSLCNIPPATYLPINGRIDDNPEIITRGNLFERVRLSKAKRDLLQEMDTLIIDEASMLRADLLDLINHLLQGVRRNRYEPFGGVQLIFIGDLFQLPPVVRESDRHWLSNHYDSPYFFDSQCLRQNEPQIVEFDKIYRQTDQDFIDMLNALRNGSAAAEVFEKLNEKYEPGNDYLTSKRFVLLTTHNRQANEINHKKINEISHQSSWLPAEIEGEFPEHLYPTPPEIELKVGAQIMFIKNDSDHEKSYYNGKLAEVVDIQFENDWIIQVRFENKELYTLKREKWENIRFEYDAEEDKIKEKTIGTFSQFPVKPAWAITIHKSQGLTFDELIIDCSRAFAHGQLYVALSRCRSLKGIRLTNKISHRNLILDSKIVEFMKHRKLDNSVIQSLEVERKKFKSKQLQKEFDFYTLDKTVDKLIQFLKTKREEISDLSITLEENKDRRAQDILSVADKFKNQIRQLIVSENWDNLHQRLDKGVTYFYEKIVELYAKPLIDLGEKLKSQKQVKSAIKKVNEAQSEVIKAMVKLENIAGISPNTKQKVSERNAEFIKQFDRSTRKQKRAKGESMQISVKMFRSGMGVDEIALERNLAKSTIYGHFAKEIREGRANAHEFLEQNKIKAILNAIDSCGTEATLTEIREFLGNGYGFNEIRLVTSELHQKPSV